MERLESFSAITNPLDLLTKVSGLHNENITFSTSLSAEDQVITDIICKYSIDSVLS